MTYTVAEAKQAADEINRLIAAGETGAAVRKAYALRRRLRAEVRRNPELQPNLQKAERAIAQMEANGLGGLRIPWVPVAGVLITVLFAVMAVHNANLPPRESVARPHEFASGVPAARVAHRPAATPSGQGPAAKPSASRTPTSPAVAREDAPIPRMTRRRNALRVVSAGAPAVAAVPQAPPSPAWDDRYLADAREAVGALESMSSLTRVGVSYRDYPSHLQVCQATVDRFLSDHPREEIPNMNAALRACLAPYHDVYDIWSVKFEGSRVQQFVPDSDPRFQALCRDYPSLVTDLAPARTEFGWHIDSLVSQMFSYASVRTARLREALRPYGV